LQNVGDNFQNPCVEAAGVSATIDVRNFNLQLYQYSHELRQRQSLIQTFHSSSSADLEDTRGLLALGKYLGIGILLNITTEDYISRLHDILLDAKTRLLVTGFWCGILDAASSWSLQVAVHCKSLFANVFHISATRSWKVKPFILYAGAVVLVSVTLMIRSLSRVWWQVQAIPRLTEGYMDKDTEMLYY
jgi:hypothetical protein